jgi:hypothetical protein
MPALDPNNSGTSKPDNHDDHRPLNPPRSGREDGVVR